MDNLAVYEKYRRVPDEALKPFDNGNFKGADINSMWRIKCLTEQFGIVGHGWTVRVLRTWIEKLEYTNEILAFAEVEMRVKVDGEWGEPFTATGGNKMCTYVKSKDYYKGSDEAFKMAITDALGVACKYLGIGADVYWANDKSKYTEEDNQADKGKKATQKPTELTPEEIAELPFNVPIQPKQMTVEEAGEIEVNLKDGYKKLKELTDEQLSLVIKHSVVKEWREGANILLTFRGGNK